MEESATEPLATQAEEMPVAVSGQSIVMQNGIGVKKITERHKLMAWLRNNDAVIPLLLWYFFSACTLFTNKYIVSYMNIDSYLLGGSQILMTMVCAWIQLQTSVGCSSPANKDSKKPPGFIWSMFLVGALTTSVILFGLVALKYVAVSFAETVKSSAPIFTVVISWLLLGERTSLYVNLSLIPVMLGLAFCSSHELSFDLRGFIAAMATNLSECLQSVYVKKLLNYRKYKYNSAELQFYPGVAGVLIQLPIICLSMDIPETLKGFNSQAVLALVGGGIFYYLQTATAYVLMEHISPVTYSVANTTKRALLIWISVILFGNPVTLFSGLGTCVVIAGVFLYNRARRIDCEPEGGQRTIRASARRLLGNAAKQ